MSSRNRSAAASCVALAAAPSLRPATLLLKWDVGGGRGEGRKGTGAADEARDAARETKAREVSVRRLAAGVWRLRPPEAVDGGGGGGGDWREQGPRGCRD
ncbi:unnamed protein product [Miscanthus lutarioriparius]|uniref:Uncharacterized protein n=1 Tax=Miscanthus lutarioriparius TaxID=422564 RepID=A0A811Q3V9_9POAL|nr:unnamed protein product [Miscanthus lutarioriparius]